MTRTHKSLAIAFVALLGLWGCAQNPGGSTVQAERIRALEQKTARLEEDFRAAAQARDALRTQLARAEEQQRLLQTVVKERDQLRLDLKTRTAERDLTVSQRDHVATQRDAVQGQYDSFRKTIRELIGQAETTAQRGGGTPGLLTSRSGE